MMKKMTFSKSSMSNANGYTAVIERLYPWILLAVIMAFTWLLAQAFWLVVAPPKAPNLTPVPLQPSMSNQNTTANALDIFAQPQLMQAQAAPPPDIKVLGVTVASPERFSYAIINANGKTQNYRVHDTIEGSNYVLTAVKKDHIMVSSGGGQPIKIQFGQPFSLDQSDAIKAKLAQANGMNGANPTTNTIMPPATGGMTGSATVGNPFSPPSMPNPNGDSGNQTAMQPNNAVNSPNTSNNGSDNDNDSGAKNALSGAVSGLQQNPSGYLSQMGITATGQGYLVTDGMPAGLKNRLGLQTGDKVLSVNGQSVGQNPAQDAQLLQQVQQSGQAQIQVQRGDQTVTVRQSF